MRLELIHSAIRHREMLYQMMKREILSRYRGSFFGIVWSLLTPLILLMTYTYFFSFVFNARWGTDNETGFGGYAIILFVGLIVHGIFSECINRAPHLVVSNPNYVKKIIFPIEILPWVTLGNALFHAGISFLVLLAALIVLGYPLSWTMLYFPMILVPFILMIVGWVWLLSGVGVYFRDIGQATGIITSVLLFVSPIFYSLTILPPKMQLLAQFNPLTLIITELRNVLIFATPPNWQALCIYTLFSFVIAMMGFNAFQKMRQGFADVM